MSGRSSSNLMRMSNLKGLATVLIAALGLISIHVATAEQFKPRFKVLNFFLHDRLLADVDPSAFVILPPLAGIAGISANPNQSFFGTVVVFDDSMTVSPDESSLEIGRGRGFYLFDVNSTSTPGVEFSWTAEFNQASGFPGSTLTFKGFDKILDPVREIAIVGGTGEFRLARGWAVTTTYSLMGIGNANLNITAYFQYGS